MLASGLAAMVALPLASIARAASIMPVSSGINPELFSRAQAALARHAERITLRDRVGLVDFAQASRTPRFHIVDMASGHVRSLLVAHGRGSDPEHSGWVERFSNEPGSNASSAGAYLTGDAYSGAHGASRRLIGLDAGNSNAEMRAIVIHAAAYVGPEVIAMQGKLGRSEGCLAVSPADIASVLDVMGAGRLIYADRV